MQHETMQGAGQQPQVEHSLESTLRKFNDAFNRHDAREVASFWAEDGTLLTPSGQHGRGRAEIESVYGEDSQTILHGSTSRFAITDARSVGADCVLLDLDHEVKGLRRPDGTRGDATLHLVVLARRSRDGWQWLDARPYMFVERPQRVH